MAIAIRRDRKPACLVFRGHSFLLARGAWRSHAQLIRDRSASPTPSFLAVHNYRPGGPFSERSTRPRRSHPRTAVSTGDGQRGLWRTARSISIVNPLLLSRWDCPGRPSWTNHRRKTPMGRLAFEVAITLWPPAAHKRAGRWAKPSAASSPERCPALPAGFRLAQAAGTARTTSGSRSASRPGWKPRRSGGSRRYGTEHIGFFRDEKSGRDLAPPRVRQPEAPPRYPRGPGGPARGLAVEAGTLALTGPDQPEKSQRPMVGVLPRRRFRADQWCTTTCCRPSPPAEVPTSTFRSNP